MVILARGGVSTPVTVTCWSRRITSGTTVISRKLLRFVETVRVTSELVAPKYLSVPAQLAFNL